MREEAGRCGDAGQLDSQGGACKHMRSAGCYICPYPLLVELVSTAELVHGPALAAEDPLHASWLPPGSQPQAGSTQQTVWDVVAGACTAAQLPCNPNTPSAHQGVLGSCPPKAQHLLLLQPPRPCHTTLIALPQAAWCPACTHRMQPEVPYLSTNLLHMPGTDYWCQTGGRRFAAPPAAATTQLKWPQVGQRRHHPLTTCTA